MSQVTIFEVARATSASPLYFPSIVISGDNFVDGGVFCNDPSMCVVDYIMKKNQLKDLDNFYLLSLGTGKKRNLLKKKIDRTTTPITKSTTKDSSDSKSLLEGLLGFKNVIMNGMLNFDVISKHCKTHLKNRYVRVNPKIISEIDLDNGAAVLEATICADQYSDANVDKACEMVLSCVIKKKYIDDPNAEDRNSNFQQWLSNMGFEWKNDKSVRAHYLSSSSLKSIYVSSGYKQHPTWPEYLTLIVAMGMGFLVWYWIFKLIIPLEKNLITFNKICVT